MRLVYVLFSTLILQGCVSVGGDALMIVKAASQSAGSTPVLPDFSSGLDVRYRYLWVQAGNSNPALLVLGFDELTPNGLLETWYSREGDFMQTLNGRLGSLRISDNQWLSVKWQGKPALKVDAASEVQRMRDVLPGYIFGVIDQLRNEPVLFSSVPMNALPDVGGTSYWSRHDWFREQIMTQPGSMSMADSWFASGSHRGLAGTVASFQCMNQNYCLKLARWPLEPSDKL